MRIRRLIPALAGLLTIFAAAATQARTPEVRAALAPSDAAGLEDIVRLEITVEAEGARQPPTPRAEFVPQNLQVVAGPAQSTSLRIVNGVAAASQSLTWHLRPVAPGPARIREIEVRVGSERIRLADLEIEIVEGSTQGRRRGRQGAFGRDPRDPFDRDPLQEMLDRRRRPRQPRRAPAAPEIYLEAEVTPRSPVAGEQVLFTLYLYTQANVRSVDPRALPDFEGFWVSVLPRAEHLQPEEVTHRGERIHRVVLLQRALFPRRAGTFEIEPIEARLVAEVPDASPFGRLLPRTAEIVRESNAVEVRVRDLPEPVPAEFRGAVGRLRLEADLAPGDLAMGDAATLTLELSGAGHLQGLQAPELPDVPGLRFFPPQQTADESVRGTTVRGVRTWSYVVVPERPGSFLIPPIEIPYFDPGADEWRVASAETPEIRVQGAERFTGADGETLQLHPIRTAALPPPGGSKVARAFGLPYGGWLFGAPWLLAALVLALRGRGRPGSRLAGRHLVQSLRAAGQEERPRDLAARVEEAWREFLTERFEIPPGTASPQWKHLLEEHGVPEADARALVELADDLHYLRYAPKLSSVEGLRDELLERSRRLARSLS